MKASSDWNGNNFLEKVYNLTGTEFACEDYNGRIMWMHKNKFYFITNYNVFASHCNVLHTV